MKRFWLSFIVLACSVGIAVAGIVIKDEALVVIGLICASFNASVYSACVAATVPMFHKHIIIEQKESEVNENAISSGDSTVVGDQDSE